MEAPRFVAVGDLFVDIAVAGERGHGAAITVRPGGTAANTAVWAAELGAHATVLGAVGDDFAGRALRSALEKRGVEADLTVVAGAATGTFAVVGGDRYVDRGANAALRPQDLPRAIAADVIALSRYLPAPAARAAAGRAEARWVAGIGAPLDGANAVVLDEEEATEPIEELARRFELVCITRGPLGATAALAGAVAAAGAEAVGAGEAIGAGDAFAAALLLGLADLPLAAALANACRIGADAALSPTGWPMVK
jgi:sugar/nucleoside kinase (ribokinase family)